MNSGKLLKNIKNDTHGARLITIKIKNGLNAEIRIYTVDQ